MGLFFFLPLLNHGLRSISGREAVLAAVGLMLAVIAVPYSKFSQVILLGNGYSTIWLMILYILGGLMGRFEIPGKLPGWLWGLSCLAAVAGSYLPRMLLLTRQPLPPPPISSEWDSWWQSLRRRCMAWAPMAWTRRRLPGFLKPRADLRTIL